MNTLAQTKKYLFILFIVGFVVYFPIFFNGFVWDDFPFIVTNPEVHQVNLQMLLGSNSFNSGPFYRPIPAIYFASVYSIFGQQAFFYHALQLILHIVDTYLLFIFFRHFFTNNIAFFLALLFLVHPINVESVAYIGSTQSELYFLPGIVALLLSMKQRLSRSRLFFITGFLFVAVMTKETGFLFILLIIAYRYIFKLDALRQLFLSSAVIVIIYCLIRLFVGGVYYTMDNEIPIAGLSFLERLLNIPAIILYYLKTFILPVQLSIWQFWVIKSANIQNFYLPLFYCSIFIVLLLYSAFLLYKKASRHTAIPIEHIKYKHERKTYIVEGGFAWRNAQSFLFFLFWFVIGIGLLLQIVPLDMTVADRWFYFPIIGLLGLIGIGLQLLQQSRQFNKTLFVLGIVIIIGLLSVRTFVRNFDWKDNLTLYGRDVKERLENFMVLDQLAIALYKVGRLEEALKYENIAVSIYPTVINWTHLGILYKSNKQYPQAVSAYTSAIKTYNSLPDEQLQAPPGFSTITYAQLQVAIEDLAFVYGLTGRPYDAINLINKEGLKKFPSSPRLYYYLAIAHSEVGNYQEALKAITKSNELSPNKKKEYILNRLKNNLPL